jgi:hypothetical protein
MNEYKINKIIFSKHFDYISPVGFFPEVLEMMTMFTYPSLLETVYGEIYLEKENWDI